MFTTVNEEVEALESMWVSEENLDVLHARLTIRLEGLKARYRQGRPGFTARNIRQIEALFEGLHVLEGLDGHLQGLKTDDASVVRKHTHQARQIVKRLGTTALSKKMDAFFQAQSARLASHNEKSMGWHPQLAPLYSSSLSMASVTC